MVTLTLEWPGRCADCHETIEDWSDAGLYDGRWLHKACWSRRYAEAQSRGMELPGLRSPLERIRQLEWPMLLWVLMFHFGLGAAVAGWIMINQDSGNGLLWLVIGLVVPAIGVAGAVMNIVSRRRIEQIRQELDAQGGWKPGR
jgi:hypothetical protein